MGFRTSFYKAPISYLDNLKNTVTPDEDEYIYYSFDDECVQRLFYDIFTNSVLDKENDLEYFTPVFNGSNPDQIYYRQNKEQFKNFIKYVLQWYTEYRNKHLLGPTDYKDIEYEIKNYKKTKSNVYEELNLIDKLLYNQSDFNMLTQFHASDNTYVDEIFDNPWKVSMGWSTPLMITNLIHVYHMMDWSKDEILVVGG